MDRVSMPTAGVGTGPRRRTSIPTELNPAVRAFSNIDPERRVSLPITTRGLSVVLRKYRPVAIPSFNANSAAREVRTIGVPRPGSGVVARPACERDVDEADLTEFRSCCTWPVSELVPVCAPADLDSDADGDCDDGCTAPTLRRFNPRRPRLVGYAGPDRMPDATC